MKFWVLNEVSGHIRVLLANPAVLPNSNSGKRNHSTGAAMIEVAFALFILAGTIIATMQYYEAYKKAEASLRVALGDTDSGILRGTIVASTGLSATPSPAPNTAYKKNVGAFAGEVDESYGIAGGVCSGTIRFECGGGSRAENCGVVEQSIEPLHPLMFCTNLVTWEEALNGKEIEEIPYSQLQTYTERSSGTPATHFLLSKATQEACLQGCESQRLWSKNCSSAKPCELMMAYYFPKEYPELLKVRGLFASEAQNSATLENVAEVGGSGQAAQTEGQPVVLYPATTPTPIPNVIQ